jgi:hypothetical protein
MNLHLIKIRNSICNKLPWLVRWVDQWRFATIHLARYHQNGWSLPMPYLLKRSIISRFAQLSQSRQFVETGTYLGDTTWYLKGQFERLWTIELHPALAELAVKRFAKVEHVAVICGDSAKELPAVIEQLSFPTLFWLDGHYCGPQTGHGDTACPIFDELEALFQTCKVPFVACIDDARLFGHEKGYPTLKALADFLVSRCECPRRWIENDIIFLIPQSHPLYSQTQPSEFEAIHTTF